MSEWISAKKRLPTTNDNRVYRVKVEGFKFPFLAKFNGKEFNLPNVVRWSEATPEPYGKYPSITQAIGRNSQPTAKQLRIIYHYTVGPYLK